MGDTLQSNPEFNEFKIAQTGIITLNKPSLNQSGSASVSHSLGIVPAVIGFSTNPTGTFRRLLPYIEFFPGSGDGQVDILITLQATASSVTALVKAWQDGSYYAGEYNFTIKYYLLSERTN